MGQRRRSSSGGAGRGCGWLLLTIAIPLVLLGVIAGVEWVMRATAAASRSASSAPTTSSSAAAATSTWTADTWRYRLPTGKDCAGVARFPNHIYVVSLYDKAGDGKIVFSSQQEFDSDQEMMRFVEGVCAKR